MKHSRLTFLSLLLACLVSASAAKATYFHAFSAAANTATLNAKRTADLMVSLNGGIQLRSVDYYLYYPASDWSDESDCQDDQGTFFGSNKTTAAEADWERQWHLFGFDAKNTTTSYMFQAWYDWTGTRSNHLTGLGSDFTSFPGDPWSQPPTDFYSNPGIDEFAFEAWVRPIGNMPGGYLGAIWRTQAYILATQPGGDCTRCYYLISAARKLGLPAGIISSNTCPGPSLVFRNGLTQVTLTFPNASPHVMAGIWHENLSQWIPFDLGMSSAGFPWLNQVIEGISPDKAGFADKIFTYYSGTGSTSVSYQSNVTWPIPPSFSGQNYSLVNTYTVSDTSADADVRIMAQCTGSSFSPVLPPHVGVSEESPKPHLGLAHWPNPLSSGQGLYLEMTSPVPNDQGTIGLYDIQGRLIKEESVRLAGLANRLWSEQLPTGIYFLKLTTTSGLQAQDKITITR